MGQDYRPNKKKNVHIYVDVSNVALGLFEHNYGKGIDWRIYIQNYILPIAEKAEFFFFGGILEKSNDPVKDEFLQNFYSDFKKISTWTDFQDRIKVHISEKPVTIVKSRRTGKVVDFKCDCDSDIQLDAHEAVFRKQTDMVILFTGDRDYISLMKRIKYRFNIPIKFIAVAESTAGRIRREFSKNEVQFLIPARTEANLAAS